MPGNYQIQVRVWDGSQTGVKDVTITVGASSFGPNVALGKATTASTYYLNNDNPDFVSGKAVDAISSTIWHPASSELAAKSWWQVDMATPVIPQRIELVTRQSTPQAATRRYFQVLASNDAAFGSYDVLGGQGFDTLAYKGTWVMKVMNPKPYRYFRVRKVANLNHTIAEFRVFELVAPLGVPLKEQSSLDIFPNPASSYVVVRNGESAAACSLTFYNTIGQAVHQRQARFNTLVSIENLTAGLYFLTVQTPQQAYSLKMIKQ